MKNNYFSTQKNVVRRAALCCIFADLFAVWLRRSQLSSRSAPAFSLGHAASENYAGTLGTELGEKRQMASYRYWKDSFDPAQITL